MRITRKTIFGAVLTLPFIACITIIMYSIVLEALNGDSAAIFIVGLSAFAAISFSFAKGMAMIVESQDE